MLASLFPRGVRAEPAAGVVTDAQSFPSIENKQLLFTCGCLLIKGASTHFNNSER
jgi:hypothetical protein